jgi:hypothetical protein
MFQLEFVQRGIDIYNPIFCTDEEYDAKYNPLRRWEAAGSPMCLRVVREMVIDGIDVKFCLGITHGGATLVYQTKGAIINAEVYDYQQNRYIEEPFVFKNHYIYYDESANAVKLYKMVLIEV